jgi:hypothetical protein
VPAFLRYMRTARTSEAPPNVKKIFDGAKTYYEEGAKSDRGGNVLPWAFPITTALTPTSGACSSYANGKCPSKPLDWADASWQRLRFQIKDPHYFMYQFVSDGDGDTATFTAGAYADLDANGTYSTFERTAKIAEKSVQGSPDLFIDNELE